MKRVDWDPNRERNTHKRGISKYQRISWGEATDILASEIRRIHETYGPLFSFRERPPIPKWIEKSAMHDKRLSIWRAVPGVIYMDYGARHDPILPGKLDRGGAINTRSGDWIMSKRCVGQATSG